MIDQAHPRLCFGPDQASTCVWIVDPLLIGITFFAAKETH
eukprot:COSAG01_NODE_55435_length_325_cov_0.676991_1_plen_39_part_10